MWRELRDARTALGWGMVFAGYAVLIIVDHIQRRRRAADDTRARLILADAAEPTRVAKLIESEGIEG